MTDPTSRFRGAFHCLEKGARIGLTALLIKAIGTLSGAAEPRVAAGACAPPLNA